MINIDINYFKELLDIHHSCIERFVRFRLSSKTEADDILQETYLTAYQKFWQLKNKDAFKPWIMSIAQNKCNDYFRKKATRLEIPIDDITEKELSDSRYGIFETSVVRDTLSLLSNKDKQILYLYFWKELPQSEIAKLLNIPLGTVKSRLYTAKQNFKNKLKGNIEMEVYMKKLPEFLPEYKIEESINNVDEEYIELYKNLI